MNDWPIYLLIPLLILGCKSPEPSVIPAPSSTTVDIPMGTVGINWQRLPSPTLEGDRYVSSDGLTYSGSGGGLAFYAVDRNTNFAKPTIFYPDFGDWNPRFYSRNEPKDAPMRFGPFNANFTAAGNVNATLRGGGYYKQGNGDRFFLKDFRIEGIDGYTWEPPYPGADVPTSSFGLNGYGYVLENKAIGKLWRFNPNRIQWEAVSTAPDTKEARFVSFDLGERAFVLPEPDNWDDALDGFYEFLPAANAWQKRKPFPGENRRRAVAFASNSRLYYGAGQSAKTLQPLRDIWAYDPVADIWQKVADYPGGGTVNLVALWLGSSAYVGFGQQVVTNANRGESFAYANDFWRFRP